MKVKVLPFNYIGYIVEHGQLFHTVRLASGTLIIAPINLIEAVEKARDSTASEEKGFVKAIGRRPFISGTPKDRCLVVSSPALCDSPTRNHPGH